MEFTLFYTGQMPISKKGQAVRKQDLRRNFHSQLKILWKQPPLINSPYLLNPNGKISLVSAFSEFQFVPLVSQRIHTVAELDITLLRPGPPGAIIKSGDVDNRLKIIVDSLKMPQQRDDLPEGDIPQKGETPFFCLLEDDNLITRVSINTAQLLNDSLHSSEVVLLIHVVTKVTSKMYAILNFV
jgi:hypothetical protein